MIGQIERDALISKKYDKKNDFFIVVVSLTNATFFCAEMPGKRKSTESNEFDKKQKLSKLLQSVK